MNRLSAFIALLCLVFLSSAAPARAQVDPSSQTYTGDAVCIDGQDFCLSAIYSAKDQAINYTMVVKGSYTGWRAVGQGSKMKGSNMLISWVYDGAPVLSHRGAAGDRLPTEAIAPGTFASGGNVSRITSDSTIVSWSFPQTSDPGNAMAHIWGVNTQNAPASSDSSSSFNKHNDYGDFNMDFTKAYAGAAPAVPSGVTALPAFGGAAVSANPATTSSGSNGASSTTNGKALSYHENRVWIAHMSFMLIAWVLLVPIGILVARFGRLAYKWFPAHRAIQSVAILFGLVGFFLAVGAVQAQGSTHFKKRHEKLGLATTILSVVQGMSGQVAHVYKHKAIAAGKQPSRWIGISHIFVGLTTFGLAIATVATGFGIWTWWDPPSWTSIPIFVWAALLAAIYFIAAAVLVPREVRKEREERDELGHEKSLTG
ncbi:CBD9-like protein [Microstroma glucosiphilum]|uniref:CBD9-like protein n=1 Tax=Pseudomicrostroma glucosiphilum TaxID=1684307 RepID=A0A316UEC5_9BASI|nr:CBD9-like protein [Pseudomicrostroma glucosiphilum]PWN22741.1 CBD9-like protein [Pseudomicrostroma glucosiphilum]